MSARCSVTSAALSGVNAVPITVEVALTSGLPGISIVGMVDTAIQEARERVKAALKASGFAIPQDRIVVNLAPGDLKKGGSVFDLPIALGVLVASGQLPGKAVEGRLFVGELSLGGALREVDGTLAYGILASKMHLELVSATSRRIPIEGLRQARLGHIGRMHSEEAFSEVAPTDLFTCSEAVPSEPDFKDIAGHDVAKRAMQIAAAGNHGLLMVGPPGSGKTLLASCLPSILPPLEKEQMLEAAAVHSVAGFDVDSILKGSRPFRSPHHSATSAGMLGGGTPIKPGEVSLAHCGVLFLDELAEFKASVLQGLRQPIENGEVLITRAAESVRLPASFMIVAATNPCPCGYYGDLGSRCTCTSGQVRRYQARIGGPLIDRFDMQLEVQRIPPNEIFESGTGTSSSDLLQGVLAAREFAAWRNSRSADLDPKSSGKGGSRASAPRIVAECGLDSDSRTYFESIAATGDLSSRGLVSSLKVARTIADMEQKEKVGILQLSEAMSFKVNDVFGG